MTIECADTFRLASRSWPRVPLVWSWSRVSPLKFVHLLCIRPTCNGRSVFRALLFRISCVSCVVCLVSRVSYYAMGDRHGMLHRRERSWRNFLKFVSVCVTSTPLSLSRSDLPIETRHFALFCIIRAYQYHMWRLIK